MMDIIGAAGISASPAKSAKHECDRSHYLFSPTLDFLGLGGASLLAFFATAVFLPAEKFLPVFSLAALWISHLVNHPHFAHSYQIFYRNFSDKLSGRRYSPALQRRYWFAGIIVPVGLIGFAVFSFVAGAPKILAQMATLMGFLVGWHYVKQGYGMAMVDAVLKKKFYTQREKTALMVNAYATWIAAWLLVNRTLADRGLLGFDYYVFDVPDFVLFPAITLAGLTFVNLLRVLIMAHLCEGRSFALNGLFAYGMSLYPWLFFRDVNPLYFALVPAFHSLQYLTVVWRYELNSINSRLVQRRGESDAKPINHEPAIRLFIFYAVAMVLGFVGFWAAPVALGIVIPFDSVLWGGGVMLFIFWTFINVHHYAMDNVMWRKGNPDVAAHLFGAVKNQNSERT